jgi:hypothetical protein
MLLVRMDASANHYRDVAIAKRVGYTCDICVNGFCYICKGFALISYTKMTVYKILGRFYSHFFVSEFVPVLQTFFSRYSGIAYPTKMHLNIDLNSAVTLFEA